MYTIYKITNTIDGKVYVGKTSLLLGRRIKQHKLNAKAKLSRLLYDAINECGWHNFAYNLIELIEDKDTANEREKF